MENVKVRIKTIQTIDSAGNEDTIELTTEATLEKRKHALVIDYNESELTESEGSRIRLKIYSDKMLMTKIGTYSSKMKFQEGLTYNNIYATPYGSFDLDFNTIYFKNSLNNAGRGNIYIEYRIVFGKSGESFNKIKIDIF